MMDTDSEDKRQVIDATPWLVLFTILLLVGKVVGWWSTMSWFWVFSPLWLPFALMFGILALLLVGACVAGIIFVIMEAIDK